MEETNSKDKNINISNIATSEVISSATINNSKILTNDQQKYSMMDRIFLLPSPLLNIIFGEYLPLINLARFDNSVCNHRDRIKFLNLLNDLNSDDYMENLDTYRNPKFFFFHRWLYQRHINYKHIKLGCIDPQEFLIRTVFPQKLEAIEKLDIEINLTHHIQKVVSCLNTKTVKICVPETPLNSPIYNGIAIILSSLHKIEEAWFDTFAVTDQLITALVMNNSNLQELYLAHALYVSDNLTQVIGQYCHNLRKLSWSNMDIISDVAFCQIIKGCPNLENISMQTATEADTDPVVPALTNMTLLAFASYSKKLKVLCFQTCVSTPNLERGLAAIGEGCTELEQLFIHIGKGLVGTTAITDAGIMSFAEKRPSIKLISLSGLDALTDVAVSALGTNCTHLQELYLHAQPNITGETSFSTLSNLKSLYQLRVGSCSITDDAVLLLTQACPQLEILVLEVSRNITDVGIVHIANHLTNLQLIGLAELPKVTSSEAILEICRKNERLSVPGIKMSNLVDTITIAAAPSPFIHFFDDRRPIIHPDVMAALRSITVDRPPASPHIADIIQKFAFHFELHGRSALF